MSNERVQTVALTDDEMWEILWGLKAMIKDHEKMIALNVSDFCSEYAQRRIEICKQAIAKIDSKP